MSRRYTVDIDIGGTLTDGLFNDGNRIWVAKVDTTPHDFTICFFDCLREGATLTGHPGLASFPEQVAVIRWSSTIATNVLALEKGPRIGLLVSPGHEEDLYEGERRSPAIGHLVSPENIAVVGDPANQEEVLTAIRSLLEQGARRICVSLEGASRDNSGEIAIKQLVEEQFPDHYLGSVPTLLGSEIGGGHPNDRTRTHMALINAYVHTPLAMALFQAEDDLLSEYDYRRPLYIGHVNGGVTLLITTDRTSNGPVVAYPSPYGPGGSPQVENWVLDSFAKDPWAGAAMYTTGENVAQEADITREELDEVTLLRYEQYQNSLENDREFQRDYMVPVEIPQKRGETIVVEQDFGVYQTTREGLEKLEPVAEGGVVTYGNQTHPADGTAGMVVTGEERARELSPDGIVRLLAIGFARAEKARMPKAPVPAARIALADAGIKIEDVDGIKTHNPFAVNDVYLSRQTGVPVEEMNDFGSSLVYGHPQGPTGARLIAELIEHLKRRGGGMGLFTGCAAGDTGAALVLRVGD